jgi:hypothetical protein
MSINRDNYEEYFLLYADNELTDSEKAELLLFVKHNRDLEEEFRMIHHTISKPDMNVELADKSFLFRTTENSFINEANYEEIFILYHDNELSENEKMETEAFLSLHLELKDEFDLIGLARLTPERSVVFPGKKILFKGQRAGRVVPILFWRMLAAAVVIGFGLWIVIFYFQSPAKLNQTVVHADLPKSDSPKLEKKTLPGKKPTEPVVPSQNLTVKNNETIGSNKEEKKQKVVYQKNGTNAVVANNVLNTQKPKEKNSITLLPEKINTGIIVANDEIKNISLGEISSIGKIEPSEELIKNTRQNNDEKAAPLPYAKNASYVTDADTNNENYVFYDVTSEKFRKTKVGSFLKKVKRVVERNNPITRLFSGDDAQVVSN